MPARPSLQKTFTTQTPSLPSAVRGSVYQLQNQLTRPQARAYLKRATPRGNAEGDQTAHVLDDGRLLLSYFDAKGNSADYNLPSDISSQVGYQEGSGVPTLANFPNPGDNGQYFDTATSRLWIVRNRAGTLIYPNFVSISGTITGTQHSDLSAFVGTLHAFTQISGSITAAQHGNFTATAANDNLHALATAARPGFLSASDFSLLAGATSAATASTLVQRNGTGGANFAGTLVAVDVDASGHYEVDGTQVVSNRNTGWTTQTATASKADLGATPTAADIAKWCSAVQAALTTHGLLG